MNVKAGLSWLKLLFVRNAVWKAVSLVLAIVIYFSIRSEVSHVREVTFPVEVEQQEEGAVSAIGGAVVESVEPQAVRVVLRGSYADVTQLAEKDLKCLIRPRQKGTILDTVRMKIRSSNLRGFRGARVIHIEPDQVNVKFDVPSSRQLDIEPPLIEGRARGRVELSCELTHAVVKGSRRLLSPLDEKKIRIQTEPINVEGRTQTYSTRVKLLPPGEVPNGKVDPPEMMVNVKVINEKTTAKIEHIPIEVLRPTGAATKNWKVLPAWVDVEVSGRAEVVRGIVFGDLLASVNGDIPVIAGVLTNDVPVTIHIRQGLTVDEVKIFPATVKLVAENPPAPPETEDPAKPPVQDEKKTEEKKAEEKKPDEKKAEEAEKPQTPVQ